MVCCENCFRDYEVKAIIQKSGKKGNCDICNSENVSIYNTDQDNALKESFEGLVNIYVTEELLPDEYPLSRLKLLKEELREKWNIFSSSLTTEDIDTIVKNICRDKFVEEPEIFENKVGIPELAQMSYLDENSIVGKYSWEEFVQSIKIEYRFHTNFFKQKVLEIFCTYIRKNYKKGTIFYRARISDSDGGYTKEKMGAPPIGLASAGRANPEGISYLYLGDSVETTLYEIRAGLYDYVSVGKFVLKEDINVVDLTDIDNISAFSDLDFKQHAINRTHLKKINNEIARPLRRHDSRLDYLPTQYICDYIKSIELDGKNQYQGIEYKSTMRGNGYNLAIFDESLFECTEVAVYDINEIEYEYDKV